MWGILDLQSGQIRPETYVSREQAIAEFADYWRNIAYQDYFDSYEFDSELTEEQKDKLVWDDLKSIDDETFLIEYYNFLPVKLAE